MGLETLPFDSAEHLDSEEAVSAYLSDALASGDRGFVCHALGQVARARGMAEIARLSGVKREALYRALRREGNPEFGTILKVIGALGLRLSAAPVADTGGQAA